MKNILFKNKNLLNKFYYNKICPFTYSKRMNISNEDIAKQFKLINHYFQTFPEDNIIDYISFNQSYLYHLRLFNELSKYKIP